MNIYFPCSEDYTGTVIDLRSEQHRTVVMKPLIRSERIPVFHLSDSEPRKTPQFYFCLYNKFSGSRKWLPETDYGCNRSSASAVYLRKKE